MQLVGKVVLVNNFRGDHNPFDPCKPKINVVMLMEALQIKLIPPTISTHFSPTYWMLGLQIDIAQALLATTSPSPLIRSNVCSSLVHPLPSVYLLLFTNSAAG